MSEFSGGKTRVRRALSTSQEITSQDVPEFSSQTGVVTVTRLLRGPAGVDGVDGDTATPESATFAYDGDGKLISVTKVSGVTTLSYDGDDKLITVVKPDHTKTLAYNGSDQLISVTVS